MSEPWRPEGDAWRDGGSESWRGDLHYTDDASWRSDSASPWQDPDSDDDAADSWAIEDEPGDWPEEKAGPEYWLFRRDLEGDK